MSRASALPEAEQAELAAILRAHVERYPRMQPPGAKLLCQNEFGGGRLMAGPAASLAPCKRNMPRHSPAYRFALHSVLGV